MCWWSATRRPCRPGWSPCRRSRWSPCWRSAGWCSAAPSGNWCFRGGDSLHLHRFPTAGRLSAYTALLGGQFRSITSYRASFVVETVTNIGATALDLLTVIVLFSTTRQVPGFTLPEALLIVSLSSCGFALADFTVGNIDRLKTYVRTGLMDAVLVRPLSALAQLILMDLPVRKALRVLLGAGVL